MPKFIFTKKSKKIFLKLPKEVKTRIASKLILLKDNEDIFANMIKIKDTKADYYRLRVGSYRLILKHTEPDTFRVSNIAHRKNVYRP